MDQKNQSPLAFIGQISDQLAQLDNLPVLQDKTLRNYDG